MNFKQYDYIRFTWADLNGYPRGKTLTNNYAGKAMEFGLEMASGWYAIFSKF